MRPSFLIWWTYGGRRDSRHQTPRDWWPVNRHIEVKDLHLLLQVSLHCKKSSNRVHLSSIWRWMGQYREVSVVYYRVARKST